MSNIPRAIGKLTKSLPVFFFLLLAVVTLLPGCSLKYFGPKLDYQYSAPWFGGEALIGSPVVFLPVITSDVEQNLSGLEPLLVSVAQKKFQITVIENSRVREVIKSNNLDQDYEDFLRNLDSAESLDQDVFIKLGMKWHEQMGSGYSMLVEVKHLEQFRDSSVSQASQEVEGQTQVKETRSFKSGVRAAVRLSVIRNLDGELAWAGEKTDDLTKSYSQSEILEGPGKENQNTELEAFLGSVAMGGKAPDDWNYPKYPSYESAIEKDFVILLKSLKKKKPSSP